MLYASLASRCIVFRGPKHFRAQRLLASFFSCPAAPAQDSSAYGKLTMVGEWTGGPRPLLEVAAREAFWSLPVSFLKRLADHKGWDYTSTSLADLLQSCARKCIPDCSDEVLVQVLGKRLAVFDADWSLDDLLGFEYIADLFDRELAEEMNEEVKKAKQHKGSREDFSKDLRKVKDPAVGLSIAPGQHGFHSMIQKNSFPRRSICARLEYIICVRRCARSLVSILWETPLLSISMGSVVSSSFEQRSTFQSLILDI